MLGTTLQPWSRCDQTVRHMWCGVASRWSTASCGTPDRVRTKHLQRDPRATLFVFGTGPKDRFSYLTLDTTVTILDGPKAADLNQRLFTVMQAGMNPPPGALFWEGTLKTTEEFLQIMADEKRLIYEFAITGSYGMF